LTLLNVIAKSWTDPKYKAELLKHPKSVLANEGLVIRDEIKVKVIDQKPDELYVILPPRPEGEINVEGVTSKVVASIALTRDESAALTIDTIALTIFGGGGLK
jgi:Nitrile hydratase, alpha chain